MKNAFYKIGTNNKIGTSNTFKESRYSGSNFVENIKFIIVNNN